MEPLEGEARIAEIVASGRATRRGSSRAMWLAASLVGAVCALGFALLLVSGDDAGSPGSGGSAGSGATVAPPPAAREARSSCAGGLGLGLGLGLAAGYALGRRHSSRSKP